MGPFSDSISRIVPTLWRMDRAISAKRVARALEVVITSRGRSLNAEDHVSRQFSRSLVSSG